jgi:hypothetical protein
MEKKKPKIHALKLPSAYQSNHEEKLHLNSDVHSINFHKSKINRNLHRNLENVINTQYMETKLMKRFQLTAKHYVYEG